MASRDKSDLPIDSQDTSNSHRADLNSDALFSSLAGPSGITSGNNDPKLEESLSEANQPKEYLFGLMTIRFEDSCWFNFDPSKSYGPPLTSKDMKCGKNQPKSILTTPQTVTKGDFVSKEKSREKDINSDIRSTKEDSSSSSFLRMAEVLRKYDKPQEPSTSKNNEFEFGPRIFTDKRTDGNSSISLSNSGESTAAAQTVFDITITAVKQLNNRNGSTVVDIVSYLRTNLHSREKILFQDVNKALQDATAAGFLAFANGKYKEIPKSIEENTSKEPDKRKTTRVNDNSKTVSKRVKPTPTAPTRSLRP